MTARGAWLQVKEGTPNAHVLWNVLIDQGQVERLVLCPDDETGSRLLQTRCSREPQIGTIWCRDDRAGPVQMQLKGHSETSFPWNGAPPRAMLSSVRRRLQQRSAPNCACPSAHELRAKSSCVAASALHAVQTQATCPNKAQRSCV